MAQYYAEICDGLVCSIHVVADQVVEDGGEQAGSDLLAEMHGGEWVLFTKDGSIRYNRPNIGWTYDSENDAFIGPKPFQSWTLNDQYQWVAPTPYPNDGKDYEWDEDTLMWVEVEWDEKTSAWQRVTDFFTGLVD